MYSTFRGTRKGYQLKARLSLLLPLVYTFLGQEGHGSLSPKKRRQAYLAHVGDKQ